MLSAELIDRVLAAVPSRTVGLIGDLFLDRYFDIDAALDEPSVETGLTAYQVAGVRCYPGALGTVMNNLAALGVGRIHPITAIGDDGEGYDLRRAVANLPGAVTSDIVVSPERRTPTYSKPMRSEGGASRELNRLDIKNRTPTPTAVEDDILARIHTAWNSFDAVIVLDQVSEAECGVVTTRVRETLAELGARDPGKFVLADSRERIGLFRHVCVKPNEREFDRWSVEWNFPQDDPEFDPGRAFWTQVRGTIFLTAGEQGIVVRSRDKSNIIPAYPVSGPIDICGAGDSCSAGITCAMTAGLTPEQAAAFGNLVASITVQQIGVTGTASPEQVRSRWEEVSAK